MSIQQNTRTRNIGIVYPGLKPPERTCNDDKCPWHGNVSVRGLLLTGKVIKAKMQNTVVVEREYVVWVRKFKRYERRRSRIHVHNPPCISAKEGDIVLIGETRPLAKSVSFVVLGVIGKSKVGE
ncbi:30S ribosomal protein S17 [Ignisphaera sp. 4213-co]|uniref:Small ribosomal subunit protein uS17 n=1 Tax=Ignisphaera cupida TaxID=3050454 RepID=A0ABD4Z473_9CREN|nr:30S ribosomal protein S17 [Ignisphaera sp. 4213-co]MDK6027950.1 30S ribosomal protein S17 [Ignisphaera sp. 4213-co]